MPALDVHFGVRCGLEAQPLGLGVGRHMLDRGDAFGDDRAAFGGGGEVGAGETLGDVFGDAAADADGEIGGVAVIGGGVSSAQEQDAAITGAGDARIGAAGVFVQSGGGQRVEGGIERRVP